MNNEYLLNNEIPRFVSIVRSDNSEIIINVSTITTIDDSSLYILDDGCAECVDITEKQFNKLKQILNPVKINRK